MSHEYHLYRPAFLGLNGVTFASSRNSNPFGVEGMNQLTLTVHVTYVAATDISFYLQHSEDGTNWAPIQIGDLDPSTGIETLRPRQFVQPVSASENFTMNIPLCYNMLRIATIVGTAATTDSVVMYARGGRV